MSDYPSTFSASDSGFLNSLHDAHQFRAPRRGVDSCIGSDANAPAPDPDLEGMLRDVPLPTGLEARLKQFVNEL